MARFSLAWRYEAPGLYTAAGHYSIRRIAARQWELRYRGTLLHTGSPIECQVEADRHRGISRPGVRSR